MFSSDGSNLDFGDWNHSTDAFVASVGPSGARTPRHQLRRFAPARRGWAPAISADASAAVFASGSAVDCDIAAGGEPVLRTIRWYVDDTYEPSLDNTMP